MNQPGQTAHSSSAPSQSQSDNSSTSSSMQHQTHPFNAQNNFSPTLVPSPSAHDAMKTQPYNAQQSQQFQQQQQQGQEQQYQNPATNPSQSSEIYPHHIHGVGGPTATAPFLRDFSLVAEAARRAQVSVVTRDLEGISL